VRDHISDTTLEIIVAFPFPQFVGNRPICDVADCIRPRISSGASDASGLVAA